MKKEDKEKVDKALREGKAVVVKGKTGTRVDAPRGNVVVIERSPGG